jgi:GntR family transcriptional regulator, rspAB operon transcriptional repressor
MSRSTLAEPLPIDLDVDRRKSRSVQIYDVMRAAIVTLQLKPGEPISENRVCRQFEVSRTPVREAIIRLSREELINVFPHDGSYVAPIKLRKVVEGHFVRDALEIAIMKRVVTIWNRKHSRTVRAIINRQTDFIRKRNFVEFHRQDELFHLAFAACIGMNGVWSVVQEAKTHLDRVRHLATPVEGHMERIIEEHTAIVDALDAGKPVEAVAALQFHLDTVFRTIKLLTEKHREFFDDFDEVKNLAEVTFEQF